MRFFLKGLLIVSMIVFIGCGGSGGSGGASSLSSSLLYEGEILPATLNKDEMAGLVSMVNEVSFLTLAFDLSTTNQQLKLQHGSVSGTLDVTTTQIDEYRRKVVSVFKNYNDASSTTTGRVTYMITFDEEEGFVHKLDIDVDLLTVEDSETSITTDGSIVMLVNDSSTQKRFTQNFVMKNNKNNKMLKIENFVMVTDYDNRKLSYQGNIYDSEEGLISISTPVNLSYVDYSGIPQMGGVVLYEGKNTILKERIAYDGRVRLELDKEKDGSIDEVEVYRFDTMQVVPNVAPIIEIDFPKEIFTNTKLSTVGVKSYDPDLDDFTTNYEWRIDNIIKSETLQLSNNLFKKHDKLKLIVQCQDSRKGDVKKSIESREQEVLNSRPVITASFEKLSMDIGESERLNYSVTDEDNDTLERLWRHAFVNEEELEEYVTPFSSDCHMFIEEYDTQHRRRFSSLTLYEQEDFKSERCRNELYTASMVQMPFIENKTFTAKASGHYIHELSVSDGEYNRTKRLASVINKMKLIDFEEYYHDDTHYSMSKPFSIYMKDFDNNGNKDLIYIKTVEKEESMNDFSEPNGNLIPSLDVVVMNFILTIEYRDGKTVLEKKSYEIDAVENYYLNDLNGDGKLDVLLVYSNTDYGVLYQKSDGTLGKVQKFSLDSREALIVEDIIGESSDDIVIVVSDYFNNTNEVKIYSKESNKTIKLNLPTGVSNYALGEKLLIYDVDKNSKKDIIVLNQNFQANNKLTLLLSILSQHTDGSFSEKIYTTVLKRNLDEFTAEEIMDVKIVDFNENKEVWMVSTTNRIYLLKLEGSTFKLIKILEYKEQKNKKETTVFMPVDINNDGKKDIVLVESKKYDGFVNIFIQTDDLEFLSEQKYNFTTQDGGLDASSTSVLGDIDNNGNYELFVDTAEERLSVLYFK